ncbi:hypothetical protein [Nonomuraea sp. NPDC049784]|uniref:hypothetical protein n=1 Tax=Nonomuraea sp. NPDC049784 TaxID=3154361 RepID=UPI0033DF9D2D
MSLDALLLAAHLLTVLTMLAGLVTDWIGVLALRGATTLPKARKGLKALEVSAAFGVWGRLGALASGLWLAIHAWSWEGWIITGLIGWTAIIALGEPLTGKELRHMAKAVRDADGELPSRIHDPRLWSSVVTRTGVIAAVATSMIGKPGLAACLGLLAAVYLVGAVAARLTAPARTPHARGVK